MVLEFLHRRFHDEFDKYLAAGDGSPNWAPDGGTWTIVSEQYRAQPSTIGDKSVQAVLSLKDQRIDYAVKYVTTWNMAFFFRGTSGDEVNNRYDVKLDSAGIYLRKIVGGTPTTLGSYAIALSLSSTYSIQIHCKDTNQGYVHIKVSLDGTERIDETDSTSPFTVGTLGMIATATTTIDVTWDNVDVWSIERFIDTTLVKKSIGDRIKRFEATMLNPSGYRSDQFQNNDEVEIWRGTTTLTRIFRGLIESNKTESKTGQLIKLGGRDYTGLLLMVFAHKSYTSQEIADIFKDLLTTYAPDFGQSNIQNTGINLAPAYKMRRLYPIGRELADISDYEVWADEEKEVFFQPRTYEDSGVVFTPTTNLLDYEFPKEGQNLITKITVFGKEGVAVQVENRALREELGYDREGTPITDPAIQTNAEAKLRGEAYLAKHSGPLIGKLFTWGQETLKEGQLVRVTIPNENINTQYVVLGIDFVSPKMPATIIVVAEFSTGIEEIISALRNDADALLATEMDLEATIERWVNFPEEIIIEETLLKVSKRTASDSFILGHATFGKLGKAGYGLGNRSGEWVTLLEDTDP